MVSFIILSPAPGRRRAARRSGSVGCSDHASAVIFPFQLQWPAAWPTGVPTVNPVRSAELVEIHRIVCRAPARSGVVRVGSAPFAAAFAARAPPRDPARAMASAPAGRAGSSAQRSRQRRQRVDDFLRRSRPAPRPARISRWQPRASGLWIEPGSANTSRPASAASRAVISAPERSAASTTSVASDSPAIRRLREGKCWRGSACRAGARSARRRRRRCARAARDCRADSSWSGPVPSTATVRRRFQRAEVRGGVDARGQAAGDDQAGAGEGAGELRARCRARRRWAGGCRRSRPADARAGPDRRRRTAPPADARRRAAAPGSPGSCQPSRRCRGALRARPASRRRSARHPAPRSAAQAASAQAGRAPGRRAGRERRARRRRGRRAARAARPAAAPLRSRTSRARASSMPAAGNSIAAPAKAPRSRSQNEAAPEGVAIVLQRLIDRVRMLEHVADLRRADAVHHQAVADLVEGAEHHHVADGSRPASARGRSWRRSRCGCARCPAGRRRSARSRTWCRCRRRRARRRQRDHRARTGGLQAVGTARICAPSGIAAAACG